MLFCRDIGIGGSTYTTMLEREIGVTHQEGESLKRESSRSRDLPEQIQPILDKINMQLGLEVKKALDTFLESEQGSPVRVLWSGHGGRNINFEEHLSQALGIPCEALNPLLISPIGQK